MRDERRSELFERYRARGDVDALAELFDDLAPALLKLARHLDRSHSEAEDIVQATFLAAIERAGSYDRARPLTPWFVGILMNQARAAHRRRRAHTPRETPEVVDPAEPRLAVEDTEFAQALAVALEKLPPAYREVLVAHLHDGKEPGVIARELGRPDGTVRAQLHRGLRLLRRVLPASFALGAAVFLRPRALARLRAEVLEHAARRAGTGHVSALPRKPAFSAPLAAALVACALVVFAWSWREPAPASAPDTRAVASVASAAHELQLDGENELPPTRVRIVPQGSETVAPAAGPFGRVEVLVFGGDSNDAVADALVTLLPFGDERWFDHMREARTGPDGRALFEHVEIGPVAVHVEREAQSRAEVVRGRTTVLEVPTPEPIALTGRVVDERGAPVADAWVSLAHDDGSPSSCDGVRSAADGSFTFTRVGSNAALGARAAGCAPSELVWLTTLSRTDRVSPVLRLARSARSLAGRVVDPAGTPVAGARVSAGVPRRDHVAWSGDGQALLDAPWNEVLSAADGAFVLVDLPAGELEVRVAAPAGSTAFARWTARLDDTRMPLRVELGAGARVHGVVRVPHGANAADARVSADGETFVARADADGAWELRLPAGPHELTARLGAHGAPVHTRFVAVAGEDRAWDVTLTPGRTIRGVVYGFDGQPFANALVRCVAERAEPGEAPNGLSVPGGASGDLTLACTDARGRFTLPCGATGTYSLEARRRPQWRGPPAGRVEHVPAGSGTVRLEFGVRTSRVTGRLVDERGRGLTAGRLLAYSTAATGIAEVTLPLDDGRFELGHVAEGRYHLRWFAGDRAPVHLGEFAVGANVTRDVGELRVATDAALEVRGNGSYALRARDGVWIALTRAPGEDGVWHARGLAPGAYRMFRGAEDTGRDVELASGALEIVNDGTRRMRGNEDGNR
jgi:RNA polymerase sigma-70 factor (ECF subfamily)